MDAAELEVLRKLDRQWRDRARKDIAAAELELDSMGRRLIRHGATCYSNCAEELRSAFPQIVEVSVSHRTPS
jgi:hypothetical protein